MGLISNKRMRKNHTEAPSKKRKRSLNSHEISKAVDSDALAWNEVAFPDRFEDAEGFFGLEEVSDVEVIRDIEPGKIEFRVKEGAAQQSNEEKPKKRKLKPSDNQFGEKKTNAEVEWEGIDDHNDQINEKDDAVAKESKASKWKERREKARERRRQEKSSKRENGRKETLDDAAEPTGNEFGALDVEIDEGCDISAWKDLELSSETLSALSRLKFSTPTPIQRAAIPQVLSGHDVIGKASTGSGKTLAFGIPIYEHCLRLKNNRTMSGKSLMDSDSRTPAALILSPTRELAVQISKHLEDLCSSDASVATITGGLSVHKQQRRLSYADVVVGTPGRLWEVINGSKDLINKLFQAQLLVIDEADRLLSEGHFKEVDEILTLLDRKGEPEDDSNSPQPDNPRDHRQTLVFSATFQKDLQQKLAGKSRSSTEILTKENSMEYLIKRLNFRESKPQFIDVNPLSQMASKLHEGIIECAALEKDLYLYATLLLRPTTRTLIFTNSITSARRLFPYLQNLNINAYPLHSQMPQKARLRSVERFSSPSSQSSILIATDVAARGLDISAVDLVIHYHVPRAADMYVHRSGRTARAERSGESILLCAPEEVQGVRRLVAKVHARNATKLGSSQTDDKKFFIRTLEIDRRVVTRLKPRVVLSKKISDAGLAKEKKVHEDDWLKTAAEDLGVDYDSEEFAAVGQGSKKGRGQGRLKRDQEASQVSKAELAGLKAELREELGRRINVGVSERYLTAGGVDVDELLSGRKGDFLGAQGPALNGLE